jgi:hypothetical protein
MEIGKLKRSYTIEPIQDPIPAEPHKPEPVDAPVHEAKVEVAPEHPARP